jgi:hypothetical protein
MLIPYVGFLVRKLNALCHPIMFSYQHVLITGCGTGLGRCLV